MDPMKTDSGFTIMELMVVIAIIAITAVIAVPSFISRLPARRMEAAASEVKMAIQLARLSAVKDNTSAVLQLDVNDESYSVTVSGTTVKRGNMPAGVDLKDVFQSNTTTPAFGGLITFDSRGFPTPPVDVVFFQNSTGTTWTIQVNMTGSSRLSRG
jgi:prepilin-type N-terminal cleavage/methylation domain-containing protein